jgi:hypothetical protein
METRRDQDGNEIQVRRIVRLKKFLCVAAPPKPKRKRNGKPGKVASETHPAMV